MALEDPANDDVADGRHLLAGMGHGVGTEKVGEAAGHRLDRSAAVHGHRDTRRRRS